MFFLPFFRKFLENSWTLLVVFWVPLKSIIPQQETSGNYNSVRPDFTTTSIIPQQEILENYNSGSRMPSALWIIPKQETSKSYNRRAHADHGLEIILYLPQKESIFC